MTATICRVFAALLVATVFLSSSPTRADSILDRTPTVVTVEQHYDIQLAHALEMFLDSADTNSMTMRGFARVRHQINFLSMRIWPTSRLGIRLGVGSASLVDSPVACGARTNGAALASSVYLAVLQPKGLSLGVEVSTLQVRYGDGEGMNEGTAMLTLSTR